MSVIPTSWNHRILPISKASGSVWSATQLHGLHDDGGHLLDAFRRRVEERHVVAPVEILGTAQLERALLQAGVARTGPALVPDLAQPQRRRGEPEAAPGVLGDGPRQPVGGEIV